MEKKIVKCPYDGIKFINVPGSNEKCSYCGSSKKDEDTFIHNTVERKLLSKEEAIEIFKKYIKKQYSKIYGAGDVILQTAWYSQHWPSYKENSNIYNPHPKRDWMGEDLLLAFEWYLDAVGRDLGLGYGRAKETIPSKEIIQLKKELNEFSSNYRHEKWKRQRKSKEKSERKAEQHGKEIVKSLNIGDVAMVKFGRHYWPDRGIQILEIEDDFIGGFYLDRVEEEVDIDEPNVEGFFYKNSRSRWDDTSEKYIPYKKLKWDGKTFKKTRIYETKMIKFVKSKIENPVIKK